MGLSSAVDWWEEWQLRILVLSSLFIQYLLLFSATFRKFAIPSWCRSIIWLAYLGSDAIAIYALATLFNRQRRHDYGSANNNNILEVVWAPVLLMHLGGQDPISAYNIEDNELWTRHVLTAVSQIAVAIYVFCKSWPGGNKRLLQASIMFFIPGILKCLEKPWALKSASINSLVNSKPTPTTTAKFTVGDMQQYDQTSSKDINTLENYVQEAARIMTSFHVHENPEEQENITHPYHLFVDIASSYSDRLCVLNSFRMLAGEKVHALLQGGLYSMFDFFYTRKTALAFSPGPMDSHWQLVCGTLVRITCLYLPYAAISLYHKSHREAYNVYDVKVTYALFCCTAVIETYSVLVRICLPRSFADTWSLRLAPTLCLMLQARRRQRVSQYSLLGFSARNKRHTMKMCVVSLLQFKDFLDQRWCMKSCYSSVAITKLVLEYVMKGWKDEIRNVDSYWKFIDHRGQWTLQDKCDQDLIWSLRRPFDKTVILWHIATDFCFHTSVHHQCASVRCDESNAPGRHGCAAVRCREMSNYMMYLLFINPEMLLPGTRRNLFKTANDEMEVLMDNKPLKGNKPSLQDILKGNKSFVQFFKGKRPSHKEVEGELMQIIITKMKARDKTALRAELPLDADKNPAPQEGFVNDAWMISKALSASGDEKMWEVIQGVWVEMLCFSASRCRGYLHAKSLGTGGELLTYIWLLLSHMGMETFPERLQRTELSSGEGKAPAAPSTFQNSTATGNDIV